MFLFACSGMDTKAFRTGFEGKPMPVFNIRLLDSVSYFNTEKLSVGKKTLLFYFSPSCPYCRLQTKRIVKNIKEFKSINICMVAMAPYKEVLAFDEQYRLNLYKNITVGIDTGHVVVDYFKQRSVPFIVIYSESKLLEKAFKGTVLTKELTKYL